MVTNYTLHGKNVVHMSSGSDELHFFYDAANKPAVVVYNGTAYAYVKNLQGDIIAILDQSGNAVVQYTYDAWGKPLSTTGSMAATLGAVQPFRYRGYVFDQETGLYYLRSRYYHPSWCRFIIPDSISFLDVDKLKNRNVFAYCDNYPIACIDSNGRFGLSILGVMAIGGLIGGLVSAAFELGNQLLSGEEKDAGTVAANVGLAFISGFCSGALTASPAGQALQVVGSAAISGVTYWASCEINDKSFDTSECIISCCTAALFGYLGGDGLTHEKNTFRTVIDAGENQISREMRRRNQEYAARQITKIQQEVIKNTIFTGGKSFAIYATGTFMGPRITMAVEPLCESIESWISPSCIETP